MKKILFTLMMGLVTVCATAQVETDIIGQSAPQAQTVKKSELSKVVFSTNIHCEGCKKRIEKNIAFEKGVKELVVDIKSKTVSVIFKTQKTNVEMLQLALGKLGFESKVMIVQDVK